MDSLDSDELDPQALVNKMMEYGIFTEGTEVLDFNITGEDDNKTAVLNLNQAENNEGVSDNAFLVEIGNTFVENFELSKLTLQVNGKDLAGAADLSYEADYENVD
ncbi:MAG: GerMN domain-containing protein [Blautia massiliensis (ex Durand et al. 2017)]